MRILLYSDYPALFEALQEESKHYSGLEVIQSHPATELLTLPDFKFMLLAPLAASAEVGASPCSVSQLDVWHEKIEALTELCSLRQTQLILLSSDLVFSADQQIVNELDAPTNTSALAKSLLKLEKKVAELPHSIILRTPPSLSAAPNSGLATLLNHCKQNQPAESINYRGLQPLDDLARVLLGIILQIDAGAQAWGLYHYAGSEAISQQGLLDVLAAYLDASDTQQELKKPLLNQLSLPSQQLLENFGIHPRAWRKKLPELLEQLK